jgi:hypothetical protein
MASRRKKLEVEETSADQEAGPKLKLEEQLVYVTTVALFLGIIMILIMMGSDYDAGLFG